MKNITKVQTRIEPNVNSSIAVSCPYCGAVTMLNRLLTEATCKHFEDFTLFKRDADSFCEIEGPKDEVVMIEATFRHPESRYHGISVNRTGILTDTDDGMKLTTDGKFESFISHAEFAHMLSDDEDADIVRGE